MRFGEIETLTEPTHFFGNRFVRKGGIGFDRFLVLGFQMVAPGVPDVRGIAVIGGLIDDKIEIVVACYRAVGVVKL